MNIVLIGYRCSGKSSVGRILAGRLKRRFLDADELIEYRAKECIDNLIRESGWDRFRELEKEVIRDIACMDHMIIATGGGAVMASENTGHLRKNGWVVWLRGDPVVLKERMGRAEAAGHIRPSLTGCGSLEELNDMLEARKRLYQEASDLGVDTTMLSVFEVADSIVAELPEVLRRGHHGRQ